NRANRVGDRRAGRGSPARHRRPRDRARWTLVNRSACRYGKGASVLQQWIDQSWSLVMMRLARVRGGVGAVPGASWCWGICCLMAGLLVDPASANAAGGSPERWKAGVARVVITPEEEVWLAGYGTKRVPDGKLHDLWAKAVC